MTQMLGDKATIAARFRADGFATIPNLADSLSLQKLRELYDGMLNGSIHCPGTDRALGGLTRQILRPHLHHPWFADNPVIDRAREISKPLLESEEPEFTFSMLIYKPPIHPHATPWHQDLAYGGMPFTPAGLAMDNNAIVQFWVALDDVDEKMGCMEFVPGAQIETCFPHFVISGEPEDDRRLLAIIDPESHIDLSKAVKCPLKAGWSTVHGYTTPHYTGPNQSSRGRRAYIFTFSNPVKLEAARQQIGLSE